MSIAGPIKSDLFREPSGRRSSLLATALGLLMLGLVVGSGAVSESWLDPKFALLGLAFVAMGTAESLPGDVIRLAGVLRIAAICSFLSFGGIAIATTLLNVEGQAQLIVVFYSVVSILFAATLYVAWELWKGGRSQ